MARKQSQPFPPQQHQGAATPAGSNVIRSHIPRARQIRVGRKRPFVYEVELALRRNTWTVERRYSEFFSLHSKIKGSLNPCPNFPPKKIVKNKDPKFVDLRRRELEKYLEDLLGLSGVLSMQPVLDFLEVPPELLQRPARALTVSSEHSSHSNSSMRRSSRRRNSEASSSYGGGELLWVDMASPNKKAGQRIPDLDVQVSGAPDIVASAVQESLDQSRMLVAKDAFSTLFYGLSKEAGAVSLGGSQPSLASEVFSMEPSAECPLKLQAVSSYTAADSKDLSFSAGDTVSVVGVDEATGWWVGTLDGTTFGLVPMNFLQQPPRSRTRSGHSLDLTPPSSPLLLSTPKAARSSPLVPTNPFLTVPSEPKPRHVDPTDTAC